MICTPPKIHTWYIQIHTSTYSTACSVPLKVVHVFACILYVFCMYFVCILYVLYVSVCTVRLALLAAKNTCRYIRYAQDMHSDTYKYIQYMHFLYVSMYLYVFVCIFKDTYKIHTRYIQIKQCISAIKKHFGVSVPICMYLLVLYLSGRNSMYLYVSVCITQMCTRHSTTIHSFIPSNLPPARRCQRRVSMIKSWASCLNARRCRREGPEAGGLSRRRSQSGHRDTANSISDTNKHEIYAIHLKY